LVPSVGLLSASCRQLAFTGASSLGSRPLHRLRVRRDLSRQSQPSPASRGTVTAAWRRKRLAMFDIRRQLPSQCPPLQTSVTPTRCSWQRKNASRRHCAPKHDDHMPYTPRARCRNTAPRTTRFDDPLESPGPVPCLSPWTYILRCTAKNGQARESGARSAKIRPVALGGEDGILRLITAGRVCNVRDTVKPCGCESPSRSRGCTKAQRLIRVTAWRGGGFTGKGKAAVLTTENMGRGWDDVGGATSMGSDQVADSLMGLAHVAKRKVQSGKLKVAGEFTFHQAKYRIRQRSHVTG
jgi:hypothetical protein